MENVLKQLVESIERTKEKYSSSDTKQKIWLRLVMLILNPCSSVLKLKLHSVVKLILTILTALIMLAVTIVILPFYFLWYIWTNTNLKKSGKITITVIIVLAVLLGYTSIGQQISTISFKPHKNTNNSNLEDSYSNTESENNTDSTSSYSDETKDTVLNGEYTEKQTELTTEEKKELNSIYSKLTDKQFALLTELLAKSFYSFTLTNEELKTVESDSSVMSCLTEIYNYAYDNYFELDPEYKAVFATKYDVVTKISNYKTLKENFIIDYYFDNSTQDWIYTINSYSLNKDDIVIYDDELYIDAEGYLSKGVIVYWLNDGIMEVAGEIKDIAYNKKVNGTTFVYAINIDYYDDPASSGWTDGEIFLRLNKNFTGKPIYYVNVTDVHRNIIREEIDFSGSTVWKPLKKSKPSIGTEVYTGISNSKSYVFTIVGIDIASDTMLVKYPSGSTEYKSYSAIMNNEYLYIK